jgi:hypothetical protein
MVGVKELPMSCSHNLDCHRWHDGELADEEARRLRLHLEDCAECQAEIRDLTSISTVLSRSDRPAIAQDFVARLHQSADGFCEQDLFRIARWLTAAAVLLLALGLAALFRPSPAPSPMAAWEVAMLDPRAPEMLATAEQGIPADMDVSRWTETGDAEP